MFRASTVIDSHRECRDECFRHPQLSTVFVSVGNMSGTREVKKTEAGKDYQIEMLTKRTTRLKKNLASEIGVFEVLTQNGEPEMVRHQ